VRFFLYKAQIRVLPLLRRSVALGARPRALAEGHGSIAVAAPPPGAGGAGPGRCLVTGAPGRPGRRTLQDSVRPLPGNGIPCRWEDPKKNEKKSKKKLKSVDRKYEP